MGKQMCESSRRRYPPVFEEGDNPTEDRFKRGKLVNFRVSEEEFAQIAEATRASGMRTVSMFARTAVLAPQSAPVSLAPIEDHLLQIDRKLEALFRSHGSPVVSEDSREELRVFTAAAGTRQ